MPLDPENLANTRATYDRVAVDYAAHIGGELAGKPLDRALLACFAEQVDGMGTVVDMGCGPGHVAVYLHGLGVPMIGDRSLAGNGDSCPAACAAHRLRAGFDAGARYA